MLVAGLVILATLVAVEVGPSPAVFAHDEPSRSNSALVGVPPAVRPVVPQPEAVPQAPSETVAHTGIDVAWLLPLGAGLIILGTLLLVLFRRHRHDDLD
ncbi:MAG TPA: hypothetical protein DCP11_11625 [Microbacteriaceae bacterium]|nr:hypothetical protein [Microbacteriaceae bacterium]